MLYSKLNSIMMTIIEDTYKGRHDLQNYPIIPLDIPAPLNLLQHMEIDASGRMIDRRQRDRPEPGKPAHVDFRTEMNCLVALSACPETAMTGKPVRVQVFDQYDLNQSV